MRNGTIAGIAIGVLTACLSAGTVKPVEDETVVLHNPDMGWVLYENYPVDSTPGGSSTLITMPGDPFAGVDEVAVMFSWFDIEREEGTYDFSSVDHAYDYWKKHGKKIQLRMSTETLLWWDHVDPPRGKGAPAYVVAMLSDARKQRRNDSKYLPAYDVCDARDPYYLTRLEKFLAAVAEHYRGERAVTLIDLRGFGVWGEWHSGFKFPTVDDRREALKGVIDRYSAAFKDHYLSMSYSYDPDGPKELYEGPYKQYDEKFVGHYDDYLHYSAFDYALTKPNVTFRRDGAGGAVHSNERKLCDQAFATLTKGPFFSEFMDGYVASKKGGTAWVDWKVADALSLHPNYVNLLGYQCADAMTFINERRDLFDHGLRTMGYRLVPIQLEFPDSVMAGQPFDINGQWVNRGVGRAMRKFQLKLTLSDAAGKTVATADAGAIDTDQWVKGKTYNTRTPVILKDVPVGQYELSVSLIDPSTKKEIGLPLKEKREGRGYAIGSIAVNAR